MATQPKPNPQQIALMLQMAKMQAMKQSGGAAPRSMTMPAPIKKAKK
jgi:hypothetical protein